MKFRNLKCVKSLFYLLIIFVTSSCNVFAGEKIPYLIKGDFEMEENKQEYDVCGVNIQFFNKAEKEIKNFTVVFFLFDRDGEPVNSTRGNLVFKIDDTVYPKDKFEICLSLDSYLVYIPDDECFIDYLYVSQIEYADGSNWSDPFGMSVF